jgi:hypothetical protein
MCLAAVILDIVCINASLKAVDIISFASMHAISYRGRCEGDEVNKRERIRTKNENDSDREARRKKKKKMKRKKKRKK